MAISLAEALHKIAAHIPWREESDYKAVRAAIDEHLSEEPSEQQTSEAETK